MRRAAILISALAFVLVPAARAAPPRVTVQATPSSGAAPLTVTLTASGDVATYHWDLGDGTTADGAVVQHAYPAGRFVAHVTATNATGEASQASVTVTSYGLKLSGPRTAGYGQRARFRGSLQPGLKDRRVKLIAEIVHEADLHDGKFTRNESTGVDLAIRALAEATPDDHDLLERGMAIFDGLHAVLKQKTT